MNWYVGGGCIHIILYGYHKEGAALLNALITEDDIPIFTESNEYILTE